MTETAALCDCDHPESVHSEADYDYDYESRCFVPDRRPCGQCDCGSYFEP